ncbi:MAG TPA: hypothetical protein VG126_11200 [Thermoleophilaceae bacterium]|nr:hypothetical protein [Thermoleophilaceae bacterium]
MLTVTVDRKLRSTPAPDFYLAACAALGTDPKRSAALEDSAMA